jgi:hypothetical protein
MVIGQKYWFVMKDFLKSLGGLILCAVYLIALLTLTVLVLRGSVWVSDKALPVVNLIGKVSFFLLIAVFLPLSFFQKCRGWCGLAFIYWSYFCGLSLWMFSLLVTLNLWGKMAVIGGLILAGVGILPVALLACMFKSEWSIFVQLLCQLALLFACRVYGIYLTHKADEEAL